MLHWNIMCIEPFPPPSSIHLTRVDATEMVFSWSQSQAQLDCPSLHYNIISSNCGNCPVTTNTTSVTCLDFRISDSATICTFMVQAVICSNGGSPLMGGSSIPTVVNLTGILHDKYFCLLLLIFSLYYYSSKNK